MESPQAIVIQYGERRCTLDAAEFEKLPEECILRDVQASCNSGEVLVLPDIGDATLEQFETELEILLGTQQGITDADVDHLCRRLDWWRISAATPLPHVPIATRLRIAALTAQAQNKQQPPEELRSSDLCKLVQHSLEHDTRTMRAPNFTAVLIRRVEKEPLLWFRPFLHSIGNAEAAISELWHQLDGSEGADGMLARSAADDSSQAVTFEEVTLFNQKLVWDFKGVLTGKLNKAPTVWPDHKPGSWRKHVMECLKQEVQRSLRDSFTGGEKLRVEVVHPPSVLHRIPDVEDFQRTAISRSFHMMVRVSSEPHWGRW